MCKKSVVLCIAIFFASLLCYAEEPSNRTVSEKFIANVTEREIKTSPDNRHVAYFVLAAGKVGIDGKIEKIYGGIKYESFIFSPDSKRVAYIAISKSTDKPFVVVDGKEGRQYDFARDLIFSPDSRHVAYEAQVGDKWCMVVNGRQGKKYDSIISSQGAQITFDSPTTFQYLATRDINIYLVQEKILSDG